MNDNFQAWVEYQYSKGVASAQDQNGSIALPANMSGRLGATNNKSGIKENKNCEAYNNPFEMVPTVDEMIKQMSSTFLSVTLDQGKLSIHI